MPSPVAFPQTAATTCSTSERGVDVVRHVFRVASSLDSLVVGEPQILGQVKEAFDAAKGAGTMGTLLGRCFTQAFATAKRVRSETGIAEGTVSVSSIACELAKKIFGNLEGRRTLLLGAGEMGESAATESPANRHEPPRHQPQRRASPHARGIVRRPSRPLRATQHGARRRRRRHRVHGKPEVHSDPGADEVVVRTRRHRPLFIIDIAVPRDVDPRVGNMDNVFVYDVDDLQQVAEENLAVRAREAAQAEHIVEEELDAFLSWRRSLELAPTIVALRKRFGADRGRRAQRALPRLEGVQQSDRAVLEAMGRSMVNKLLHQPMTQLKAGAGEPDGALLIDAVRRLFAISEEQPEREGALDGRRHEATVTQLATAGTGSTGESK